MLLRFRVSNFLSIRDPQELSLVAASLADPDSGLISSPALAGTFAVPAVVVYGANASGKSNLVAAMRFMRSSVLFSHSRGQPNAGVPRSIFALDPRYREIPSSFDVDFIINDVRYHYGFEASSDQFVSEWLIAFPKGRRQTLFTRKLQDFSFGRALKGQNRVISELTRPNSLFVSAAAQNDHEELSKISSFLESIQTDFAMSVPGGILSRQLGEGEIDDRVIRFLSDIGTGVVSYRKQEQPLPERTKVLLKEFLDVLRRHSDGQTDIPDEEVQISIELAHKGVNGNQIFFDLDRESAGTRRLLPLLGHAFAALDAGTVLVVDELDASLHTRACEAVLELFSRKETNPRGAQLVTTTHDTNLLRSRWLRRDQVWFTEKDAEGATHLYPLSDFRTRKADNIEKGYLEGRYGAIPFSGSISELVQVD